MTHDTLYESLKDDCNPFASWNKRKSHRKVNQVLKEIEHQIIDQIVNKEYY